jgi:hypothetical protein
VLGGADVNVYEGDCLTLAVARSDLRALELLLEGSLAPQSRFLDDALSKSTGLKNFQARYQIMERCLTAEGRGRSVVGRLIDLVDG